MGVHVIEPKQKPDYLISKLLDEIERDSNETVAEKQTPAS